MVKIVHTIYTTAINVLFCIMKLIYHSHLLASSALARCYVRYTKCTFPLAAATCVRANTKE